MNLYQIVSHQTVDIENISFLPNNEMFEIETKNKKLKLYNYQKEQL